MKTAELLGAELDCWVARAEGMKAAVRNEGSQHARCWVLHGNGSAGYQYAPSTNWAQGGVIIEREKIALDPHSAGWDAKIRREPWMPHQPSPLVAAMRAYVAVKFGDEVE